MSNPSSKRFSIALSFHGEYRSFVEKVAEIIADSVTKSRVLYDKYLEVEFAKLDLDVYLPNLYRNESELIVIFLCPEYKEKRWCNLEWRFIKQLIATIDQDRIMLVSFGKTGDLTDIGILPGDGYIDIGTRQPDEISALILQRYALHASHTTTTTQLPQKKHPNIVLEDPPRTKFFLGRSGDIKKLISLFNKPYCKVVVVHGMPGFGKSSLVAEVYEKIRSNGIFCRWVQLINKPTLAEVVKGLNISFSLNIAAGEDQLRTLKKYLKQNSCLLVLDNLETLLDGGNKPGEWLPEIDDFNEFINWFINHDHASCIIITSRELPKTVVYQHGVQLLTPTRLSGKEAKKIFLIKNRTAFRSVTDEQWERVAEWFLSNPLALQYVASFVIGPPYEGDFDLFFKNMHKMPQEVAELIDDALIRLNSREMEILYWMAVYREPIGVVDINGLILDPANQQQIHNTIHDISGHFPLEVKDGYFWLQPVLLEQVTKHIVLKVSEEILRCNPEIIARNALLVASAKDFVRQSQLRVIVEPILKRLHLQQEAKTKLVNLLEKCSEQPDLATSYLAGNILNLMIEVNKDVRGLDFSKLAIRQAFLRDISLVDVNFSDTIFYQSIFAETFANARSVAFDRDERFLATAGVDGIARIWNLPNLTLYRSLPAHHGVLLCLSFNRDGTKLASGCDDGTIYIWNTATGDLDGQLQSDSKWVMSIAFSPVNDQLIAGCDNGRIVLYRDIKSGEKTTIEAHRDRVGTVSFSSDGKIFASGGEDSYVRIWNSYSLDKIDEFRGDEKRVFSISFNPTDTNILASGGEDCSVKIWEIKGALNPIKTLVGHNGRVRSVAFSPDGTKVVSGAEDRKIIFWNLDANTRKCASEHANRLRSVAFSPRSAMVASVADDQTVRLWDSDNSSVLHSALGHIGGVKSIFFIPGSTCFISAGNDRTVRIWDIDGRKEYPLEKAHTGSIWTVAISNDGKLLATGGDDQDIQLWDMKSSKNEDLQKDLPRKCTQQPLKGHSHRIFSLAFSPNNRLLASGSEDQTIRIWECRNGIWAHIRTLNEHQNGVTSIAFHPKGDFLASGSDDHKIVLWDCNSWKVLDVFDTLDRINSISFSPDGTKVASGGSAGNIYFWDIETKKSSKITLIKRVISLGFQSIGKQLAVGCEDGDVTLYNIDDFEKPSVINTMKEGNAKVNCLAFSPDGAFLVSAKEDDFIDIWNLEKGILEVQLKGERLYERMNVSGASGLTDDQIKTLKILGAVD